MNVGGRRLRSVRHVRRDLLLQEVGVVPITIVSIIIAITTVAITSIIIAITNVDVVVVIVVLVTSVVVVVAAMDVATVSIMRSRKDTNTTSNDGIGPPAAVGASIAHDRYTAPILRIDVVHRCLKILRELIALAAMRG